MESISSRIIKVAEANQLNKSEFARRIKVTPAYISKLSKQPDSVPSDRTIADICREFNVNEEWLRTGAGPMFSQDTVFSLDQFVKDRGGTDLELEIVKAYFSLPTEIRETVISQFKAAFMKTLTPAGPDERTELHAELDRQMNLEKEAAEKSEAYSSTG